MRTVTVGVALWVTSVLAAPAFANWFDGSSLHFAGGHKLLIGSAPPPTHEDLCAVGDSNADRCYTDATHKVRKVYVLNEKTLHYHEAGPRLDDKPLVEQAIKPVGTPPTH